MLAQDCIEHVGLAPYQIWENLWLQVTNIFYCSQVVYNLIIAPVHIMKLVLELYNLGLRYLRIIACKYIPNSLADKLSEKVWRISFDTVTVIYAMRVSFLFFQQIESRLCSKVLAHFLSFLVVLYSMVVGGVKIVPFRCLSRSWHIVKCIICHFYVK